LLSTLYHTANPLSDSLRFSGNFLQEQPAMLHPAVIEHTTGHLVFYFLFGLISVLAFIRFFYPTTLRTLFFLFAGSDSRQNMEKYSKPGWAVPLFLTLNFMVGMTLFILILLIRFKNLPPAVFTQPKYWAVIAGGIILYYLALQSIHFLAGFVFQTPKLSELQVKNTALGFYVSGIVLTPLLLIYFYTGKIFFIDFMLVVMGLIFIIKWIQTIRAGLSARTFHPLHLFLYLCAVEIIPLLLLVKTGIGWSG